MALKGIYILKVASEWSLHPQLREGFVMDKASKHSQVDPPGRIHFFSTSKNFKMLRSDLSKGYTVDVYTTYPLHKTAMQHRFLSILFHVIL